jgi:hypothetical protein
VLIQRPPELAVLPAGYGPLFDRAASVFAADDPEQSIMAAREAAFALFFAGVPAVAESNGIIWPGELEQAVRACLDDAGLPLAGPATAGGRRD